MSAQLDWLDLLETHRADYLATARVIARDLAARRGTITILGAVRFFKAGSFLFPVTEIEPFG